VTRFDPALLLACAAAVFGVSADSIALPIEIDGVAVTTSGAAVAIVWVTRQLIGRLDRVLTQWERHMQAVEDLHREAVAVPRRRTDDRSTPIEVPPFDR
jgi:hypothetical protein